MATELGVGGLPTNPQSETLEWSQGLGETRSIEYTGEKSAVLAKYESLKEDSKINQATYSTNEGRARVIGRFVRNEGGEEPTGVTIIEELFGIDVIRAIYAAPLFSNLNDDQIAQVLLAVEARQQDADIEDYGGWNDTQKELRWQMLHGQETYFETAFVLRIRKQGVRSAALAGTFTGINTVVDAPTVSAGMLTLITALPAGEWLYKPPQVSYVQRGQWNVDSEWHWAVKWSVVYGGTMKEFL